MPTPACEDATFILRRVRALRGLARGLCPKWVDCNFSPSACWCHEGSPDGKTLPCPMRPDDWQTPQGVTAADYAK